MSEKLQHTTALMRVQMENRYGDGLHHKHNKMHNPYRKHCKSHPAQAHNEIDSKVGVYCSTGHLHAIKLRKIRKRLDKGRYH